MSRSPQSIFDLLATRVELNVPVTQRQIAIFTGYTGSEKEKGDLQRFVSDEALYQSTILAKRYSILDLLDDYPSIKLPFSIYVDMLKPLMPRQYSISSSPLASSSSSSSEADKTTTPAPMLRASITYDIHSAPSLSNPSRLFHGVATTYLASLTPGQKIHAHVRSTNRAFHLPPSPSTPLILICAGSGIAPMRGFLQERAAIAAARRQSSTEQTHHDPQQDPHLGTALLYFGVRDFRHDYIYASELESWQSMGVVRLRPAFSQRAPEGAQTSYVPERMWADREEVRDLFMHGAKIMVCGSASKLAKSTAEVCKRIWKEAHPGTGEAEAEEWLEGVRETRYVSDVFG